VKRSRLETEQSFSFAPDELPRVLEAVWPTRGLVIEIDGITYDLVGYNITKRIQMFGIHTKPGYKKRLKVKLKPAGPSVKIEDKWVVEHGQLEESRGGWLPPAISYRVPSEFGPLRACLVKERATLCYLHYGRPEWEVSIDRLAPFDPLDTSRRGSWAYHLEFEGSQVFEDNGILRSAFFRDRLMSVMAPLTDDQTKWVLAESYCRHRPRLAFADPQSFREYVRGVFSVMLPSVAPIDDRDYNRDIET